MANNDSRCIYMIGKDIEGLLRRVADMIPTPHATPWACKQAVARTSYCPQTCRDTPTIPGALGPGAEQEQSSQAIFNNF